MAGLDDAYRSTLMAYARLLAPNVSFHAVSIGRVLIVKEMSRKGMANQSRSKYHQTNLAKFKYTHWRSARLFNF